MGSGIVKFAGLLAVVPVAVLLTISFFVLFAVRKIDTHGLKVFGYVVATLLWVAAAVIFSLGVFSITKDGGMPCPMMQMMTRDRAPRHEMMKGLGKGPLDKAGCRPKPGLAAPENKDDVPLD